MASNLNHSFHSNFSFFYLIHLEFKKEYSYSSFGFCDLFLFYLRECDLYDTINFGSYARLSDRSARLFALYAGDQIQSLPIGF